MNTLYILYNSTHWQRPPHQIYTPPPPRIWRGSASQCIIMMMFIRLSGDSRIYIPHSFHPANIKIRVHKEIQGVLYLKKVEFKIGPRDFL